MTVISKPNTFSPNTAISSSQINANFDVLYNDYNGGISASNLASGAVTTDKIADANVTTAKIADSNVTSPKMSNSGTWDSSWATTAITPSKTGWSSTTKNVWQYIQIGKMVWLYFDVSGTSNSTSTSVTLPVAARSISATNNFEGSYGLAGDSAGVGAGPRWNIDLSSSATLCTFFTTYTGGAWTASGTKQIRGFIIYEAA